MDVRVDYKESWVLKNLCFSTLLLEKTLESPLDCKEIKPVHPKGNQSRIFIARTFIARTDVEAATPILWPPDAKNWLIWKDPDAGKDWSGGGEGDDRGWDGQMASQTQWIWVWVNSGSWWWTRSPGMLQSMGSQRVGHDWATELSRIYQNFAETLELSYYCIWFLISGTILDFKRLVEYIMLSLCCSVH